eukprot:TRINITY_DN3177_c0_g1_i1.p2 TRINITY_DN3177_c0_g1~~TRINITY_DN3177_c0_g1_i1.p2  ORF type:complete len:186 (+),score=54.22 TRINITY_DN3177_c0_g1_i1:110-667(+)
MFKKFNKESLSSYSQVKSSEQRKVKQAIVELYPPIDDDLKEIFPKKSPMFIGYARLGSDDADLIADSNGDVWFIHLNKLDKYFPTLRTLHKYPDMLPKLQVDRGAIKFVIGGANIFCKGLTSPGARMDEVPEECVCAIMAEGKEHAVAIGVTKMSSQEILEKNDGVGVDSLHFLGDGLWRTPTLA